MEAIVDDHVAVTALAVRDLSFAYGSRQILWDVSFDVAAGERLALLGTNGAGKSTVLRNVCGLETPTSGTVMFDGRDVTGRPAEDLVHDGVGMVMGGRGVFPDLTVRENLDVPRNASRGSSRLLTDDELFDLFPRLSERLDLRAGLLSGGEQQQLALAKALVLGPRLLCIDELSLGLSPVLVESLLDVVRQINERGTTLIIVEQSLNVAAALCDRAIFLEKGSVRFEGRTRDLLDRPDLARAVFFGGEVH